MRHLPGGGRGEEHKGEKHEVSIPAGGLLSEPAPLGVESCLHRQVLLNNNLTRTVLVTRLTVCLQTQSELFLTSKILRCKLVVSRSHIRDPAVQEREYKASLLAGQPFQRLSHHTVSCYHFSFNQN